MPGQRGLSALQWLTPRELEVLHLISRHLTASEIAETLVISTRTVEGHVAHILHKLGVHSRHRAARIYLANRGKDT